MDQMTISETELITELNDLLQRDHDAVSAYTLAIGALNNDGYKETIRRFRADHERHIADLTHLIHIFHGEPAQGPHIPTGPFKDAVEAVGAMRGDTALLLSFKANERQVRDKYAALAARSFPAEVEAIVRRGAADEARHYAWATSVLEKLGVEDSGQPGRVERARAALKTKRGVATLVGSALAVVGAGAVAAYLIRKR